MKTEIKPAIARSISHNEIVLIESGDPKEILSLIKSDKDVTELDWAERDINGDRRVIDVWGKRSGSNFRLYIATEKAEGQ